MRVLTSINVTIRLSASPVWSGGSCQGDVFSVQIVVKQPADPVSIIEFWNPK
jgi:hypothetical protein